jgi:Tfp pilus assembly protein PilF
VEYFKANRMEAATEELQKALTADPNNQDAHHMLGIIALRQDTTTSSRVRPPLA